MDLPSKLTIPGSDRLLLPRPRLLDQIDPAWRLLLCAAPAGSGKTSLVLQHISTLARPVAWYTLERSDLDPVAFVRCLATSLGSIAAGAAEELGYAAGGHLDHATRAQMVVAAINATLQPSTLVLDGLQIIEDDTHTLPPAIATLLDALLLHCPNLHLIITSRSMPSLHATLPLLADRTAVVLSGTTLDFTSDEIDQYLSHRSDQFDPALRDRLVQGCHGWAMAVALASATPVAAAALPALERQHLYPYLAAHTLERLAPPLRAFVLDVSVLDELSAQRCDTLRDRDDSTHHLAALERQSLFVLESGPHRWRFQPLFRAFLLDQVQRDTERYQRLIDRALDQTTTEQNWPWAVDLALDAGRWDLAAHSIEQAGTHLRHTGQHALLLAWFARLPASAWTPGVWRTNAQILHEQGQLDAALVALDHAANGNNDDVIMATILQANILQEQGQLDQAQAMLAPYLHDPQLPAPWRARGLRVSANVNIRQGAYSLAQRQLLEALAAAHTAADQYLQGGIYQNLGVTERLLGNSRKSEHYYRRANAYWEQFGAVVRQCTTLNNMAMILMEQGDLDQAEQRLLSVLDLTRRYRLPRAQTLALASLGDVAWAKSELSTAFTHYTAAYTLAHTHGLSNLELYAFTYAVHCARLRQNGQTLTGLLDQLEAIHTQSPLEQAWLGGARAGAYWALELPGALEAVNEALAVLPDEEGNDRACLLLLRAQILFSQHQPDTALQSWAELSAISQRIMSLDMFTTWAQAVPALVAAAAAHGDRFAQRLHIREGQSPSTPASSLSIQQAPPTPPGAGTTTMPPPLVIRALGTDQIIREGKHVKGGGLQRAVFFCLLAAGPTGLPAHILYERVWGDDNINPEALKSAIKRIRRDICPVEMQGGTYVVQLPATSEYDVAQFVRLLQPPAPRERLEQAVTLYGGPYLPRFDQPWTVGLRQTLAERYVNARIELATLLLPSEPSAALDHFQAALTADPYHANAMHGVLRAHTALGRRAYAIDLYHMYVQRMNEEGLDADRTVEQVYRQLLDDA